MEKEIRFRITRIVVVILYVIAMFYITNDTRAEYNEGMNIYHSLINSLQITDITQKETKQSLLSTEKLTYDIKITNDSDISKKFTIRLKDNSQNTIDYKYINYQVITDNKILELGKIKSNDLYQGEIEKNKSKVYKIEFWVDDEDIDFLIGKTFKCEINIF